MIRSTGGFIFGGFSDKPWTFVHSYCKSDKAFLFSFKIPSNEVGMEKMLIKQNMCSNDMFHFSVYGPIFRGGPDFCISSDDNNNRNL